MLFKKIKYSLILAFCSALTFTSCNNDLPSSSPSENSSESVNVSSSVSEQPYVRDENYQWSIENQDYLHGKVDVLVGTTEEPLDVMVTKVGDQTFKADGNFNFESTLNYIGDTINSDNSNRAADFLYVNGQKLKRIVSDGAKGVTIDENLLLQGENTLTVKIGPYWTDNDYDENKNHGNKWQSCDDFGLQDVHLTLPTKEIIYPKTIVRYYPIKVGIPVSQNNTKIVEEDYNPTINERLGDGWEQFDSYYGNPENNYRIQNMIIMHIM